MQSTVKERLVKFIKYNGLSQKKFEEAVGLSNGYVNNIRRSVTEDKLQKIVLRFPELNKAWLLTGEGEMLTSNVVPVRASALEEFNVTKAGIRFYTREDGVLVMKVPMVPISALGSPDDEFAELIRDNEGDTVTVEVDAVHHGNYLAFKVQGDSMDDGTRDSFEAGDVVVVRELSRDKWLPKLHYKTWSYWVIVFGNNVRIKQIIDQDETTGSITCHSLNPSPEYCDFTLELDQISRLFNVIHKIPKSVKYGM